jgi:hypothetical protein
VRDRDNKRAKGVTAKSPFRTFFQCTFRAFLTIPRRVVRYLDHKRARSTLSAARVVRARAMELLERGIRHVTRPALPSSTISATRVLGGANVTRHREKWRNEPIERDAVCYSKPHNHFAAAGHAETHGTLSGNVR